MTYYRCPAQKLLYLFVCNLARVIYFASASTYAILSTSSKGAEGGVIVIFLLSNTERGETEQIPANIIAALVGKPLQRPILNLSGFML